MSYDRKVMRNGNGWAMSLNSTILEFLDVNPEVDMLNYSMQDKTLIIKKSQKKRPTKDKTI